jgi:hypothetical protein
MIPVPGSFSQQTHKPQVTHPLRNRFLFSSMQRTGIWHVIGKKQKYPHFTIKVNSKNITISVLKGKPF